MDAQPLNAQAHDAEHIELAAQRLLALPQLSTAEDLSRLVRAICQAGVRMLGADRELARALRLELAQNTGLSSEMVEWGLTTTFASVRPDVLDALGREAFGTPGVVGVPARLCAVVLAGNVFSAAVRAVCLPLLTGAPVLVKCASNDDVLPRFLRRALEGVDPELAQRFELVRFARSDERALDALLRHAEVVSIYGDDATTTTIGARARPDARVIRHGHGLSASFVSSHALRSSASLRDTALRLALDIAAYDQRGCLSPHMVLVEQASGAGARALARCLADEALPELGRVLPPGPSDTATQARALQWRAAAQVRGELFDGAGFAVSYEATLPLRPSPGGRLVAVHDCADADALAAALGVFGAALKCIGVAGPRELRQRLARRVRGFAPARICRAGEMQTPPFDAFADGQPPLSGLLSFVEVQ